MGSKETQLKTLLMIQNKKEFNYKYLNTIYDLVEFVNSNNIQKEDIVLITPSNIEKGSYTLFYYA